MNMFCFVSGPAGYHTLRGGPLNKWHCWATEKEVLLWSTLQMNISFVDLLGFFAIGGKNKQLFKKHMLEKGPDLLWPILFQIVRTGNTLLLSYLYLKHPTKIWMMLTTLMDNDMHNPHPQTGNWTQISQAQVQNCHHCLRARHVTLCIGICWGEGMSSISDFKYCFLYYFIYQNSGFISCTLLKS